MKESNENKKGISIYYADEEHTQVYIHPDLKYPEFLQLLSTVLLHGMKAYLSAFTNSIHDANINQKVEANKKTARKNPIPQEAVMTEKELETAYLNAAYSVHDSANLAVSNVLRMFLPDELAFMDPESLITEEAILNAELQALDSKLDTLTDAQKEIAKMRIESIKEDIKRNKDEYARMQLENSKQEQDESDTN